MDNVWRFDEPQFELFEGGSCESHILFAEYRTDQSSRVVGNEFENCYRSFKFR